LSLIQDIGKDKLNYSIMLRHKANPGKAAKSANVKFCRKYDRFGENIWYLTQLSQLGDETVILKNFPPRIVSLPHKTV